MKKILVLTVMALMSTMMLNAKSVRGYVSDQQGNPVAGVKMLVANEDAPGKGVTVVVTDAEGYFSVAVPDDLNTDDLRQVFTSHGSPVVKFWTNAAGCLNIVVKTPAETAGTEASN